MEGTGGGVVHKPLREGSPFLFASGDGPAGILCVWMKTPRAPSHRGEGSERVGLARNLFHIDWDVHVGAYILDKDILHISQLWHFRPLLLLLLETHSLQLAATVTTAQS